MFDRNLDEIPEAEDVGEFTDDIERLTQVYIDRFFNSPPTPVHGLPPREALHCRENLSLVMDNSICGGIDTIYEHVSRFVEGAGRKRDRRGRLAPDVRYVLSLYQHCCNLGIPKCFATGILILYLRYRESEKAAA